MTNLTSVRLCTPCSSTTDTGYICAGEPGGRREARRGASAKAHADGATYCIRVGPRRAALLLSADSADPVVTVRCGKAKRRTKVSGKISKSGQIAKAVKTAKAKMAAAKNTILTITRLTIVVGKNY